MAIDLRPEHGYYDLMAHFGHEIDLAGWGQTWEKGQREFVNVAIVCETCQEVLVDFDNPKDGD